ncbi:iron-containing alcohol dehydrogenase [Candidatus Bathyarchaeota archaeon]|nr:iron-containing alcohol dehydrogenase [Candidatus Bathyarchaeota archaeon]
MWWFQSPKIAFGEDALEVLKDLEGKKAFIVTDNTIRSLGYVDIVSNYLKEAGMDVGVFDGVESEPSTENVMEGAKLVRESAPDWIIGLGGGSCMDAAKVMWVLYERPDIKLEDVSPLVELGLRKKARLICIPTTSGTGSEASWAAVITDKKELFKMELASRELYPDLSIVDPKLPVGVPKKVAADTGIDALVTAVETYVNQWRNDFSDALAIKGAQLFFKYFLRAYENENDKEAREKIHNASTIAGLAFSNSQVGVAHAMGHSFGAVFKIPHGRATAVFLPYSIEFGVKEAGERYAEIAKAIGIEAESVEAAVKKLVDAIRDLMEKIGEPLTVKEMGIKWEDYRQKLDELVAKAEMSTCNFVNPRVASSEELKKLFTYAFDGRTIDF